MYLDRIFGKLKEVPLRVMIGWLGTILLFLYFSYFTNINSVLGISFFIERIPILLFVTIGQAVAISVYSIDLSVGAVMAFSSCVFVVIEPISLVLALVAVLGLSLFIGTFNGFLISKEELNPFVVTYGVMVIISGISLSILSSHESLPIFFSNFYSYRFFLPVFPALATIGGLLFIFLFFHRSKLGLHFLATGSNQIIAERSGVRTESVKLYAHALAGLFAGLAGLFLSLKSNSGGPQMGMNYMLYSMAAAVLGGCNLKGGRGNAVGILGGVLFFVTLKLGITSVGISVFLEKAISGIAVLSMISIPLVLRKFKVGV